MNEKQFAEITVNIWSLRKVVDEGCWQPHRGQGMCLRQIRILGGLNPYFETNGNGTLCRERNCKWRGDERDGIRTSSVEWRWSD